MKPEPCARIRANVACRRCGLSDNDAEFVPSGEAGVVVNRGGATMADPGCYRRPKVPTILRIESTHDFFNLQTEEGLDPDTIYIVGGGKTHVIGCGTNYVTFPAHKVDEAMKYYRKNS